MTHYRRRETYCGQLIKLPKEFVEQFDEFLSSALRSQAGETHNVCKQDAVKERENHTSQYDAKSSN